MGWHLLTRWQQNVETKDSTDASAPLGAFSFNYLPTDGATRDCGRSLASLVVLGATQGLLPMIVRMTRTFTNSSGGTPLGRLADPKRTAGVVYFLVGSDGAWINGQTIRINGGIV